MWALFLRLLNNHMNYKLYTLVDVTETGEHHGPDHKQVSQQANWNTLIQVLGLRANPTPKKTISHHADSLRGLGFGTAYKGKNRYWECEFEIEYGEVPIENMLEDFDLVPIIADLDETVDLKIAIFSTQNSQTRNLVIASDNNFG